MAEDRPQNVYNIYNPASVTIVGEQNVGQTNISESVIENLTVARNPEAPPDDHQEQNDDNGQGQRSPDQAVLEADSGDTHKSESTMLEINTRKRKASTSGHEQQSQAPNPKQLKPNDSEITKLSKNILMFNNERLCSGTRARVYRGRQKCPEERERDVAVKLIQYQEKNLKEIDVLIELNHPNVIAFIEIDVYNGLGKWIYIAMELCSQNLQTYIEESRGIDLLKVVSFLKQLADGVAYIHSKNIVHRDLKPDNILISKCGNVIKVADFGLSKKIPEGQSVASTTPSAVASEGYQAPEMYKLNPQTSFPSDVFSLGIVTYVLFTNGKHPFGSDPYEWRDNIRRNRNLDLSKFPHFENLDKVKRDQLLNLIKRMLQNQPTSRPTAAEVQNDAFLTDPRSSKLTLQTTRVTDFSSDPKFFKSSEIEAFCDDQVETLAEIKSDNRDSSEKMSFLRENDIVLFDEESKQLCRFDPEHNSVTTIYEYHDRMNDGLFAAVLHGERIYVCVADRTMFRLDQKDTLITWKPMANIIDFHGLRPPAVSSSVAIFLVGGSHPIKSRLVSKYDPLSNKWKKLKHKPTETCGSALVASHGFLYSFGGETKENKYTKTVERLDISSQEWIELAGMRQARVQASAIEYKNKFYISGGLFQSEKLSSMETYDPNLDQWTDVKPMKRLRASFNLLVVKDNFFAVGGDDNNSSIEKFDFERNEWSEVETPKLFENFTINDSVLFKDDFAATFQRLDCSASSTSLLSIDSFK